MEPNIIKSIYKGNQIKMIEKKTPIIWKILDVSAQVVIR